MAQAFVVLCRRKAGTQSDGANGCQEHSADCSHQLTCLLNHNQCYKLQESLSSCDQLKGHSLKDITMTEF